MIRPLKNIFIPINFSYSADNAIYAAIAMCKRHNANLHLLYIEKASTFIYPSGRTAGTSLNVLKTEVERADKLEKQARKIQEENNINCFFHTGTGAFYEVLAAKSKDFYCDLILLQKSMHTTPFSFTDRSAYKILKHVSCPVLTIPPGKRSLYFKNIFFPVRPIPFGTQKLEVALPIIKRNQARVSLFGALKDLSEMGTTSKFIQQVNNLLSKDKIKVETEINSSNDVATEVVKRAVEKDSDLIIISATIKKGLKSLLTSNYTEKVIDNSPIPVLSVKVD